MPILHAAFANGDYVLQTKWRIRQSSTFCFSDRFSIFTKCCTCLYPHLEMLQIFHFIFANGDFDMQTKW